MPERERAYVYLSRYKVMEEEEFFKENPQSPVGRVETAISKEEFLRSYGKMRRKRVIPIIIFLLIGIGIILFDLYAATVQAAVAGKHIILEENDFYFIMMIAAVSLAFAVTLMIKSYFKSTVFLRKMILGDDYRRICEIGFYEDFLTYFDRMNQYPFSTKAIEVIPYKAFTKARIIEDTLTLMDNYDKCICMKLKDIPPEVRELLDNMDINSY